MTELRDEAPDTARPYVLRIEVNGYWTASDLAHLVNGLDRTYNLFNALDALRDPEHPSRWATSLADLSTWNIFREWSPLRVEAAEFGSPGFWAFVGHLNPLKNITDFITDWRRENTARQQHRTASDLEQERLDLQRQEQDFRHRLEIFDRLRPLDSDLQVEVTVELANRVFPFLTRTARDGRVVDVALAELEAPTEQPGNSH